MVDKSTIYISSNPNGLVGAVVGSIFYRNGKNFYVINGINQQQERNQSLDISIFARKLYNPNFYKHYTFEFSTPPSASDTALENEIRRTGTYLTGAGNCGSSLSGSVVTFRRTYEHEIETSPQNYTEHGLCAGPSGTNSMTRALFTSGTVTVDVGQQLRVVYDLLVTISPSTLTPYTLGGTGWPVAPSTNCDGNAVIGSVEYSIGNIIWDGSSTAPSGFLSCAWNGTPVMMPQPSSWVPSLNSGHYSNDIGAPIQYSLDTYTPGTFTRTYIPNAYASANYFTSTDIGGWAFICDTTVLGFKYDQPQTKANTHRLRYPSVSITWARS